MAQSTNIGPNSFPRIRSTLANRADETTAPLVEAIYAIRSRPQNYAMFAGSFPHVDMAGDLVHFAEFLPARLVSRFRMDQGLSLGRLLHDWEYRAIGTTMEEINYMLSKITSGLVIASVLFAVSAPPVFAAATPKSKAECNKTKGMKWDAGTNKCVNK